MKANVDARARARKEKEREREEKEREEKREEEEREADLGGWSRKLRQEQEVCTPLFSLLRLLNPLFLLDIDVQDQGSCTSESSSERQEERSCTG